MKVIIETNFEKHEETMIPGDSLELFNKGNEEIPVALIYYQRDGTFKIKFNPHKEYENKRNKRYI